MTSYASRFPLSTERHGHPHNPLFGLQNLDGNRCYENEAQEIVVVALFSRPEAGSILKVLPTLQFLRLEEEDYDPNFQVSSQWSPDSRLSLRPIAKDLGLAGGSGSRIRSSLPCRTGEWGPHKEANDHSFSGHTTPYFDGYAKDSSPHDDLSSLYMQCVLWFKSYVFPLNQIFLFTYPTSTAFQPDCLFLSCDCNTGILIWVIRSECSVYR